MLPIASIVAATRPRAATAGGVAFSLANTSTATDTSSQTTYDFTSQSLGAADATRVMVVVFSARIAGTGGTINSVSIDGISATSIQVAIQTGDGNTMITGMFYAPDNSANTTGTVSLTFGAAMLRCRIALYRIVGASSDAPTSSDKSIADNHVQSKTLTIPSGGGAIAASAIVIASGGGAASLTNLTGDINSVVASTMYAAAAHNVSSSGSTAMTFDWPGVVTPLAMASVWATWGP